MNALAELQGILAKAVASSDHVGSLTGALTKLIEEKNARTDEARRLRESLAAKGLALHAPFKVITKRGADVACAGTHLDFAAACVDALQRRSVCPVVDVVGADGRTVVEFGKFGNPAQHLVAEVAVLKRRVEEADRLLRGAKEWMEEMPSQDGASIDAWLRGDVVAIGAWLNAEAPMAGKERAA